MMLVEPDAERDAIFVRIFMQTGDAMDAAVRAGILVYGYDTRTVAEYMLDRDDIQKLIEDARAGRRIGAKAEISKESIISDLENIHSAAMLAKDYTPAIASKKLQAQLMGVLQEKVEHTHKLDMSAMSDEKLMELISRKQKQIDAGMKDVTPVGLSQISGPARTINQ